MAELQRRRWELFAQHVASGRAYTEAYVLAGYKPSKSGSAESRLANHDVVKARIDELVGHARDETRRAAEKISIDKEWVLSKLVENVERAMQAIPVTRKEDGVEVETGEYRYEGAVANRALELLGKEFGMFIDRKEVGRPGEFDGMNADDIREAIRKRLGLGGEGAVSAALGGDSRLIH